MDKTELMSLINGAYAKLEARKNEFYLASLNHAEASNKIDVERARLLNSGVITGRNAETREAEMRTALVEEYDELMELEAKRDATRFHMDIAQLEVERARAILRIHELSEAN